MKSIKFIFIFIFILFNKASSGQCITTSPTCLETNQTITFSSTIPTITHWQISDNNGNLIYGPASTASYSFLNQGSYLIEALIWGGGSFGYIPLCEQLVIVGENPPDINLSQNPITICSGDSVYLALESGISLTDVIGPATYTWTTSNGDSYNELSTPIVLTTETSATLTVTDVTGCIVTETISINYSTLPSGTSLYSMPSVLCAGDSVNLTADNIDPNSNYTWYINGDFINGSSITTSFEVTVPNQAQNFEVILYIDDNSGVCPTHDIQTLIIPPTQFIVLDTLLPSWSTPLNAFTGCESMPYNITLYNNSPGINTGINSLTITWVSNGLPDITTTQTNQFDSIQFLIEETTTSVLITTNTNSGCTNTVNYNLLYNDDSGGNTTNSFGKVCASKCINSSIPFTIDPNQINLPLNAQLRFIVDCNAFFIPDTIMWSYSDFITNQDSIDISACNQPENTQWRSIFYYNFPYSSCECDFIDDLGKFKIRSEIITSCDTSSNGILFALIEPYPSTEFLIPSAMCEESSISIINNSYFGCDPLDNNSFDPSDSVYFSYNFGDSCNTVIIDTVSSENNFNPITHNYNAGTYTITLNTSNKCSDSTITETINVYPKPNISFSSSDICYGFATIFTSNVTTTLATIDTVICSPTDTAFINVPAGGNTFQYLWSGMDDSGETTTTNDDGEYVLGDSTTANPQFIFYNCGTHPVSLKVTDEHGCDSIFLDTVVVYDLPLAGFELTTVCEGVNTEFIDTSVYNYSSSCVGAPIVSWVWNFGDSSLDSTYTSYTDTFTHLYTPICAPNDTASLYPVTLLLTDANGCVSSPIERDTAIVFCEPIAEFDSTGICFGLPDTSQITFNNLSSPQSGMNWLWDFGDGTTSTETNPTHTFLLGVGTYDVELTLIGNNCNDFVTHEVIVYDNPDIFIVSSINVDCFGFSTGSINTTASNGVFPYSWSWSNNDNTQNIINLAADTFLVTVTDNNGCIDTASLIITEPDEIISDTSTTPASCNGYSDGTATLTLSGGTGLLNVDWFTMDPNNLPAGTYPYLITDDNNCTLNGSVIITEPNTITVTESITNVSCNGGNDGSAVLTTSGGTGTLNVNWLGSVDPNNLSAGTYDYTVIDINNCQVTGTIIITEPNTIITNLDSTVCENFFWNGTFYNNTGLYCNVLQNINGCDSTVCVNLTILSTLTLTVTPSTQTLCQSAASTNIEINIAGGSTGTSYNYQWYSNITNSNSGGILIIGETLPTYTPPTTTVGTMYYYCTVDQPLFGGCMYTSITAEVIINLGPSFNPQPIGVEVCEGAIISDLIVDYDNGTGTPQWQWYSNTTNSNSGGTLLTGETNPTYSPPTSPVGTMYYYATLILAGNGGCGQITSNPAAIIVQADPVININPTLYQMICVGGTISTPLEVGYINGVGTPSYQWYLNTTNSNSGGTLLTGGTNATYTPPTFSAVGTNYYYCIVSLSGNGCDDYTSLIAEVEVVDIPTPLFTNLDSICFDETPLFVISNLSTGYILDYYWQITDSIGTTVWDINLSNNGIPTFPSLDQGFAPVTYYISLTVSNNCGDSTYTDSIVVNPLPQLFFNSIYCGNAIDLPIGLPITLEYGNISFANPTNTDTIIIDWGDGTTDTVLPDCGNIAGFPNNAVCWEEVSHVYNTVGSYTICMTGINKCGDSTYCCDINVTLNQIASYYQVTSNYNCIGGDSTKFIELSSNAYPNATVNWWFDYTLNTNSNGDTIAPSSIPDESRIYTQNEIIPYLYSDPGVYLVYHNITSPFPNQYTDWNVNWNDTVFVFPKPEISFNYDNVCVYTPINFINTSTIDTTIIGMPPQTINTVKWYIDDVLVPSTSNLTHVFNSAGQKEIKLECWTNFNCYNVDSVIIDVYDQPVPNLITTSHCEGNETFIDATLSSGSVLYSSVMDTFCWDLNGISGIDSCNTSGQLNFTFPAGNNNISLILTDNLGCFDTFESTIYITPEITTDFSFDDSICSGDIVIFTNLSSPYADDYLWDFGFIGSNSNSTLENPETVFPSGGQHFSITLTTYNIISPIETCEATFTDSIYIWNKPEAIFSALPVCANETTFINNNSINTGVNIIENKWEFSDSPTYEYNNSTIVPHIFNVNNELLGEITWAKLFINDENGCRDSIVNPISIHPLPDVDFTVEPICEGDILIAEDNSTMFVGNAFPSDNITTGNWIFNNNITSNDLPIWDTHIPTQPHGNYPISLTINTSFPCSNSTQKLLTILEMPEVSYFNADNFTPNQCGDSIIFHLDGNFQADEWQYVFDNSHPYCWESILPNVTNIDYLLCQPHNYQLNINLENYNGCKDTVIYNLHTYPNPIANYSSLPNHGCEDLEVIFTDNSTINNDLTYHSFPGNEPSFLKNYNWTFGDLSPTIYNLENTSITHTYSTNNGEKISYIPSLSVETNHYCVSTYFYDSITIFPTPKAELFQPIAEGFGLYQFDGSTSTTSLNSSLYAVTNNYNFTWILGSNGNNTEGIDTISSQHYPYGEHLNNNIIDYKYESNSLHQGGYNYDVYLIVTLKEIPNCSDTTMISHKVDYWKGLFVPNALSADINNGEAALFWPKGKSLSEYILQVYDIWGNIIWESQDLDLTGKPTKESAWDGSINGIPAPQGTYIWKIYGKFSDGTIWLNEEGENTGPIYLIR